MKIRKTVMLLGSVVLMGTALLSAQIKVKNGDRIAFLGDSITQQGHNYPAGYVNMVMAGLKANGIKASMVKAGISGNRSTHMLKRVEKDVISKKPQIMTLSCGVNDVWHGKQGVALEDYKKNIRQLVDKAVAAKIQVYIMTSTMITENPNDPKNLKLAGYNNFLKELASEKNLPLIDLNAEMQKAVSALKTKYPDIKTNFLTVDGVHMGPFGNMMMAKAILKSFGLNDSEMAKAGAEWMKLKWNIRGIGNFTVKEYCTLEEKLWSQKKTISSYINEKLRELLK